MQKRPLTLILQQKSFLKQDNTFLNSKTLLAKKTPADVRYFKNIGLWFKTPKEGIEGHCIDKKCPFISNIFIRDRILKAMVISTKMQRTIIMRRDYLHYVSKYNRYEKKHRSIPAHISRFFSERAILFQLGRPSIEYVTQTLAQTPIQDSKCLRDRQKQLGTTGKNPSRLAISLNPKDWKHTKFMSYKIYDTDSLPSQDTFIIIMSSPSGTLEYVVRGNNDSRTLVVFLQGWPDSLEMWEEKMQSEENFGDYKQLYINFPNYGKEKIPWGQEFPVVVDRLKATIDLIPGVDKKILISHDWGCFYGYVFDQKYPSYFNRIVAMDVPAYAQLNGIKAKLFVLVYQMLLIVAFLIGGKIGTFITRLLCTAFKHKPSYFKKIESDRNYPYYYLWRNLILSKMGKAERYLKGYKPSVPITYYYALKKPFQFHGKRWQQYVTNNGGSVKAVDSGHWLMGKDRNTISQQIKQVIRGV